MPLSSLFEWYPLIEKVVSTPRTIMLPYDKRILAAVLYGKLDTLQKDAWGAYMETVEDACDSLGYPAFLRSDETSNKHDYVNSCLIKSREDVQSHMVNIMEFTEMVGWMGGLNIGGFAVREFLKLDAEFTAFREMPVAREFRFFVRSGAVQCWHPYWFPSCLRDVSVDDWMPRLRRVQEMQPDDLERLTGLSRKVSEAVKPLDAPENHWSIDWCWVKERGWVLTDMATGEDSYHYSSCPHASEEMSLKYPDPEDDSEVTTLMETDEMWERFGRRNEDATKPI